MKEQHAQDEIEMMLEVMFAAWNRRDLRTYAEFWTEDACLVNVLGMRRQGRAEILAELEFLHATWFKDTQIRNVGLTVRTFAEGVAVVQVSWEMHGVPTQPGLQVHDGVRRGIFTHIAVRTPQGWRLSVSQNTEIQAVPDFLEMHSKTADTASPAA